MYKLYPESFHELTDSQTISNYIHGGRGIVKLEAPSGKSHKYVFSKPEDKYSFPDDVIFVYALHEEKPDVYKKFYVGMIEGNSFRLTRNSRFLHDTEIVRGAAHIMNMANNPNLRTKMKLYHCGMCCFCGRQLSSEKSMKSGVGPRCKKRLTERH